jgi:DNA-binding NtrC family response regulator
MAEQKHILLVNGSSDHQWHKLIAQIAAPKAALCVGSEATIDAWLAQHRYAIVLIDASAVAEVPGMVRQIRGRQPCARVIVFTAAPDWTHARAAFLAGAFDYTVKSLDADAIESAIEAALGAPPPYR